MSSVRLKRESPGQLAGGSGGGISRGIMAPHVPYIDEDVIKYLKTVFVPRVSPDGDLRFYDRQVGHQEVIEHLLQLWEMQAAKE